MKEIEPDSKWEDEGGSIAHTNGDFVTERHAPVDKLDKILESNMVIIGFLSRLYDIHMAALNAVDSEAADNIYETHEAGGNFNPPMFIPDIKEQ